jgi:hypothetical protein
MLLRERKKALKVMPESKKYTLREAITGVLWFAITIKGGKSKICELQKGRRFENFSSQRVQNSIKPKYCHYGASWRREKSLV